MKNLNDYILPTDKRTDFLNYKKKFPNITVEQFVKNGLCNAIEEYDYDKIVFDFWNTGFYKDKLDLVGSIAKWGNGKLNPSLIIDAFNRMNNL